MRKGILFAMMMTQFLTQAESVEEASSSDFHKSRVRKKKFSKRDYSRTSQEVVPKGCKKYHFTISGNIFERDPSAGGEINTVVFTCIASNKKTAIKKHQRWMTKDI